MRFVPQPVENVTFLADLSWLDGSGHRQLEQQIFDAALQMIDQAQSLIVLDMFLFNNWQGPVAEQHRALSAELSSMLISKKQAVPDIAITVISDPVNTVYGGLPSVHFEQLRRAGIDVALTDLTQLQDSNPIYSGLWRWLVRPFGNSEGSALPNPFGPDRVSVRSYLALLNFKANHRKLLIADDGKGHLLGFVSSANPHDGSSAHRNVALRFSGAAVTDLLLSEKVQLSMSGAENSWAAWPENIKVQLDNVSKQRELAQTPLQGDLHSDDYGETSIQIVSESRIKESVLSMLNTAQAGERVDLLMFYLSDRDLISALKQAHKRGVDLRVLLDVNQDAFGRKKNGVPNRPVAAELVAAGIAVRWCTTAGEQCHAKMLFRQHNDGYDLVLGSGNYTRRNLDDFNLETNVWIRSAVEQPVLSDASAHFERQWRNLHDRTYSVEYETYANESMWLKLRYRFMEATGFATF